MFRNLTAYKVVLFNLLFSVSFLIWNTEAFIISASIFCCCININFILIALRNFKKFVKQGHASLFIGKKRTLIMFAGIIFFLNYFLAITNDFIKQHLFPDVLIWSIIILMVRVFENEVSTFMHKLKGRRVAVVGNSEPSLQLANKLEKKNKHFFYGRIDFDAEEFLKTTSLLPYIDLAKKNRINEFYWSVPATDTMSINTISEEAEKHCIKVSFIATDEVDYSDYSVHYISGTPVLKKYKEPLLLLRNQILKRIFDFFVSSLVMIFILSWLVPLIGLLIKLGSKGPVFFIQERSGRDNQPFLCLKFRTMKVNESSNVEQATKNDDRITKLGKFLRKTSLDELPQFINVLRGDMSVTGPRPHMLYHTEEYNKQVNNYMARLYLKPGVTGWAQAKGYRGEITDVELIRKRVEHDIWYMENWSISLDIKILWLTFTSIIHGDANAY